MRRIFATLIIMSFFLVTPGWCLSVQGNALIEELRQKVMASHHQRHHAATVAQQHNVLPTVAPVACRTAEARSNQTIDLASRSDGAKTTKFKVSSRRSSLRKAPTRAADVTELRTRLRAVIEKARADARTSVAATTPTDASAAIAQVPINGSVFTAVVNPTLASAIQ